MSSSTTPGSVPTNIYGGSQQIAPNAVSIHNYYGTDAVRAGVSSAANRTVVEGVVQDMYTLSTTHPEEVENERMRTVELESFERWLSDKRVLCVYGDKGVGITTILSQFARRHRTHCVSYFFNSMDYWRYDAAGFETDLCKQLLSYIGHAVPDTDEHLNVSTIMQRVSQKIHSDKKQPLYFVFDGIQLVPSDYLEGIKDVLNKLPKTQARFIFSGSRGDILKMLPPKAENQLGIRDHEILSMSPADMKEYFLSEKPDLTDDDIEALWDITRGNAHMMNVVLTRYMRLGKLDKLLTGDISDTADLYADDFDTIYQNADELTCRLVEILTYACSPVTADFLKLVLHTDEQSLQKVVAPHSDMICVQDGDIYRFCAVSFREYLRGKLSPRKQAVERTMLKTMMEADNKARYGNDILQLMKSLGMADGIANFLTSENMHAIFVDHKTQASLNELCNCGFEACYANPDKFFAPLFRFVVTKSVSREIERNELWDNEIEAMMSLGHTEQAFALANNVYLSEDRLKAYLNIARYKKKISGQDYTILRENIKQLVDTIEFEKIPQKAIELSTMLLLVDFEAAVGIIDRIANTYKDKVNTDRMYTLFSMCLQETDGEHTPSKDLVDAKIQNEDMRSMAHAARHLFSEEKVEAVLSEIDQMTNDRQKLNLLSIWIPEHKDKEGIGKAILKAVQLIVAMSDTDIPRAETLANVCSAMSRMTHDEMLHALESINAVEESIKSPAFKYVDAKLTVIEGTRDMMPEESRRHLDQLLAFIDGINDPAVHVACLAKMAGRSSEFATDDRCAQIVSMAMGVMEKTSLHFKVLEEPVKALAADHTDMVCRLVECMNTDDRKKEAYSLAAVSYLDGQKKAERTDPDVFFMLIGKTDTLHSHRYTPLLKFTQLLKGAKDIDSAAFLASIKENYRYFEEVEDPHRHITLLVKLYTWMRKTHPDAPFTCQLKGDILNVWRNIESERERTISGFYLVQYFAKTDKEDAETIFCETKRLQEKSYLSTSSCETANDLAINMYIKSMCLMVRRGLCEYNDSDYKQFETIVDSHLSKAEAIAAWNAIAMEFYFLGRKAEHNIIWNNRLTVNYDSFTPYDRKQLLYTLSPTIFFQNSELFYDRIKDYDPHFQDECLKNVADTVITKEAQQDTKLSRQYDLPYGDLQTLVALTGHFHSDEAICHYVKIITNSISGDRKGKPLSKDQLAQLYNGLDNIVANQLPAPGCIPHDGYKVSCRVNIDHSKRLISSAADRRNIAEMVEAIPNVSDRAFLYFDLAPLLPRTDDKRNFFNCGIETAKQIGSSYEKSARFGMMLSECKDNNLTDLVNPIARQMMECLYSNGTEKDYRELLDTVYQQKPELADELIKEFDSDPARRLYKKRLQRHLDSTKRIENARKHTETVDKLHREEQERYFSRRLDDLLDGTGQVLRAEDVMRMTMHHIYNNSVVDAQFAIFYVMEDIFRKDGKNYQEMQRAIHHTLTQVLNVAMTVSAGTKDNINRVSSLMQTGGASGDMVRIGDTDEAWGRIFEWFKANQKTHLYIVDASFHPRDLCYVKKFCDINSEVEIRILTHRQSYPNADYAPEWRRLIEGLTNDVRLNFVYYADQSTDGPLRDRYLLSYDSDTHAICGLKVSSLDSLGCKESSITEIAPDLARDIRESYTTYALEKPKRVKTREMRYSTVHD